MAGYTVVQFTDWDDGKSTSAVPLSWLITFEGHLMCYFPKKNPVSAIKTQTAVHADWPKYPVRRLSYKIMPTYDDAIKKQDRALETSGVDSTDVTDDELREQQSPSKSLKRKNLPGETENQKKSKCGSESQRAIHPMPNAPVNWKRSHNNVENTPPSQNTPGSSAVVMHSSHSNVENTPPSQNTPGSSAVVMRQQLTVSEKLLNNHTQSRGTLAVTNAGNIMSISSSPLLPMECDQTSSYCVDHIPGFVNSISSLLPMSSFVEHVTESFTSFASHETSIHSSSPPLSLSVTLDQLSQTTPSRHKTQNLVTCVNQTNEPLSYQELSVSRASINAVTYGQLCDISYNDSQAPSLVNSTASRGVEQPMYGVHHNKTPVSLYNGHQANDPSYSDGQPPRLINYTPSRGFERPMYSVYHNQTPISLFNGRQRSDLSYSNTQAPSLVNSTRGIEQPMYSVHHNQTPVFTNGLTASDYYSPAPVAGHQISNQKPSSGMAIAGDVPRRNEWTQPLAAASKDTISQHTTQSSSPQRQDNFECIMAALEDMKKNQAQILLMLTSSLKPPEENDILDFGAVSLPVDSEDGMDKLAEVLKDSCQRKQLRSCLCQIGGKELGTLTFNIMKACITHILACNYSLFGQKHKKDFSSHPLYKAIIQAILISHKELGATQDKINGYIASFLRHAPSKEGCPKYKGKGKKKAAITDLHYE